MFFTSRRTRRIAAILALTFSMFSLAAEVCSSAVATKPTVAAPSTPVLSYIYPRGMQRGTECELTFGGERLVDAEEVFFYDTGIEVKKVEQIDDKKVKVIVVVAEDCRMGEHVAQLRTKSGVTDYRNVYVGQLKEIYETEPNTEFDTAHVIEQNTTINGTIQNEDVDYFKFTAKKGERISVEIEAMRLGFWFDPYIALFDENRFEIAVSDDTPLNKQDGFFSVLIPEDGQYTIMVRETSYGGNAGSHYRLHVGNFPRPSIAFPSGGKPGETVELTFFGDPSGPITKSVQLPAESQPNRGFFFEDETGIAPSPLPLRVSDLENHLEAEPNNSFPEMTPLTLPIAINGIIDKPGDMDYFRFTAKKDETWIVNCYARSIGSGADPVVNIFNPDKKHIAGNDDFKNKPDSQIRFVAPADGDYYVRVYDHLRRGQEDFIYRLEIDRNSPKLSVGIKRTDRFTQRRQQIAVPQGNRFAVLMEASKKGFSGEIKLLNENLPPGITMHAQPMRSNLNTMPVVFEAASEATIDGDLIEMVATHVKEERGITGGYASRGDLALGIPNNALYYACHVEKVAAAVIEPVPFKIELVQPKAPLVRDGSKSVTVKVIREEGFKGKVHLQFPFRSPGLGTKHQIAVKKDQTEIQYPLNANGKAEIGKWPIVVLGFADRKTGRAWISTQLAELEIAEPRVKMEISNVNVTQGESAKIVCNLEQLIAFEDEATAELHGLPPHVTSNSPLKFNKETKALTFELTTTAEAPAGKHGPFVQIKILEQGEEVVSVAGRTKLQINKPKPPPKKPDVAAAK